MKRKHLHILKGRLRAKDGESGEERRERAQSKKAEHTNQRNVILIEWLHIKLLLFNQRNGFYLFFWFAVFSRKMYAENFCQDTNAITWFINCKWWIIDGPVKTAQLFFGHKFGARITAHKSNNNNSSLIKRIFIVSFFAPLVMLVASAADCRHEALTRFNKSSLGAFVCVQMDWK